MKLDKNEKKEVRKEDDVKCCINTGRERREGGGGDG